MLLSTTEQIPGRVIQLGAPISVTVVRAANVVRDIRENIRNLVGGRMRHYEELLQKAVEEGYTELEQKAQDLELDGVLAIRMAHPTVVEGAVELILYGTGFRYLDTQSNPQAQ